MGGVPCCSLNAKNGGLCGSKEVEHKSAVVVSCILSCAVHLLQLCSLFNRVELKEENSPHLLLRRHWVGPEDVVVHAGLPQPQGEGALHHHRPAGVMLSQQLHLVGALDTWSPGTNRSYYCATAINRSMTLLRVVTLWLRAAALGLRAAARPPPTDDMWECGGLSALRHVRTGKLVDGTNNPMVMHL